MKSVQKNFKKIQEHGKVLFWLLTSVLLLVTTFYVYLVNTAAMNGVRWSKTEQNIKSVEAVVSDLESQYLSFKQSVTLKVAYAKGFEDVKAVAFISAEKLGAVATAKEI
ncbi:MAG: hypothetical protein EXS51_01705 [Candidatus Taylorbacteria bacterium]|nr:hypothetical protein [Candidatus Taylorbacteria bacterium]